MGVTWVISVDVEKFFDKINQDLLLEKLKIYLDQSSVELIGKLCNAGYVTYGNLSDIQNTSEGVPQGSLISPLLSNIYLHAFDKFVVENLIPQYTKGIKRAPNLEYKRKHELDSQDKKILEVYPELKKALKNVKHKRILNSGLSRTNKDDPNFRRLYYTRYADDFILGFVGPKIEAQAVYKEVTTYLQEELKLTCNDKKTAISHGSNTIKYLGTLIRWQKKELRYQKEPGETESSLRVIPYNRPLLTAPIKDIFERMVKKGYATWRRSQKALIRPTSFRNITAQEEHVIVQKFNSIIRGILNYYAFVSIKSQLWKIVDAFRKSCALTLADKLRLKTAAQVFQKFGRSLSIKNKLGKEIASLSAFPTTLKTTGTFKLKKESVSLIDLFRNIDNSSGTFATSIQLGVICEYEGCTKTTGLELHHINPMVSSKRRDLSSAAKILLARERKVVTLCKKHHMELHERRLFKPNKKK